MNDRWTIHGREFSNCNCAWGCPCQFNAPTTYGNCEAAAGGIIEQGHFNDTQLDGLQWVLLLWWPGEIADEREALRKIIHGDSTEPGATHFFVFNSTMSEVLDTLYRPIEVEIDVAARTGRVHVPELVDMRGSPITDPNSGEAFRARIDLPNGFEYSLAEMGTASSSVNAGIQLDLKESYGQFNELHMNQSGVIR